MGRRNLLAQALERRASEARTLAEAQALAAQADWVRRRPGGWLTDLATQLIRN